MRYTRTVLDGILINEIQTVLHGGLELLTFKLFQLLDGILINENQTFLHDELELLTIKPFRMLDSILINEIETVLRDGLELLTIELFELLGAMLRNEVQTFIHDGLELLTIKLVQLLDGISLMRNAFSNRSRFFCASPRSPYAMNAQVCQSRRHLPVFSSILALLDTQCLFQ